MARDLMDAYFVHNIIENQGIKAEVIGDNLLSARGELPFSEAYPTVWVSEVDRNKALEIVEHFESRKTNDENTIEDDQPNWQCPACENSIESQFTACWNCQTQKPT